MRVFLTGATGFIGGAVAKALKTRGHDVVALVRKRGDIDRLKSLGYQPVAGDMCVPDGWAGEAASSDAIVHAAQVRFGRRVGMSWVRSAARADEMVMRALIRAAERGGNCTALVYTSGVSVFGDHRDEWIDEDVSGAPGPIGRYHLAGELLALEAARRGVPALVLRPGAPYAPAGTFASFFLASAAKGKFNYVGGGDNFQPFEHLDDLAEAYALAVEKPPVGKILAIVDDEPMTMKDFAQLLLAQFGGGKTGGAPPWLVALFAGRPLAQMLCESYRVKNARAKALLGWRPRFGSLKQGLPATVEEYKRRTAGS